MKLNVRTWSIILLCIIWTETCSAAILKNPERVEEMIGDAGNVTESSGEEDTVLGGQVRHLTM